jgi:hypothetical protein
MAKAVEGSSVGQNWMRNTILAVGALYGLRRALKNLPNGDFGRWRSCSGLNFRSSDLFELLEVLSSVSVHGSLALY